MLDSQIWLIFIEFILLIFVLLIAFPIIYLFFVSVIKGLLFFIRAAIILFFTLLIFIMQNDQTVFSLEQQRKKLYTKLNKYSSNIPWFNYRKKYTRVEKNKVYKIYRVAVVFLVCGFLFFTFKVPQESAISSVNIEKTFEQSFSSLKEYITANYQYNETEVSNSENTSNGIQGVHYKLKETFDGKKLDGGSLRNAPVADLGIQNFIRTIDPSESFLFYGETVELGGITWCKINASNGDVGWISQAIIEKVN